MSWQKLGVIFRNERQHDWMVTHACVPTARYLPQQDRIRVYYAPRNARGQSLPTYVEVAAADPTRLLYVHPRPVLELGALGTFDDGGIMPCSLTDTPDGRLLLYYVGWNPSVSVAYRNAVGVAVSTDGGVSFERVFPGAIVDRSANEPFFTASPYVLREGDRYHMWYASGTGFLRVADRVEPLYVIKYASSDDGLAWDRNNRTCIEPHHPEEANARATVVRDQDRYRMWFCYRGSRDYRDGADAYRIGYAESTDAVHWRRNDAAAGITPGPAAWDDRMQTYPDVLDTPHGRYLFYNGNGFGRTGIGCARWIGR